MFNSNDIMIEMFKGQDIMIKMSNGSDIMIEMLKGNDIIIGMLNGKDIKIKMLNGRDITTIGLQDLRARLTIIPQVNTKLNNDHVHVAAKILHNTKCLISKNIDHVV